jgi:hypothetical protein
MQILVTIHKEKRLSQRYSFSVDRPGPQPKRKDPKRYATASNARRGARAMLGAYKSIDGGWKVVIGKKTYLLAFKNAF